MNNDNALFEDDFAAELEELIEQADDLSPMKENLQVEVEAKPDLTELPQPDEPFEASDDQAYDNQIVAAVAPDIEEAGIG